MSRVLVGTVEVHDAVAVCVKPNGEIHKVGGKVSTFPCFGGLRRYDTGKRIYRNGGVFQMENDAQRAARRGA